MYFRLYFNNHTRKDKSKQQLQHTNETKRNKTKLSENNGSRNHHHHRHHHHQHHHRIKQLALGWLLSFLLTSFSSNFVYLRSPVVCVRHACAPLCVVLVLVVFLSFFLTLCCLLCACNTISWSLQSQYQHNTITIHTHRRWSANHISVNYNRQTH